MSTSCLMDLHMKDENDSAVTGKARQILYRSPCNVKCGILLWERDGMSKKIQVSLGSWCTAGFLQNFTQCKLHEL